MTQHTYKVGAYQTANLANLSPGDQIALLLSTAAKHIRTAKEHAVEKQYEARTEASEKAMTILEGLGAILESKDDEQEKIARDLESYYIGMNTMISHMNVTNDEKLCDSIARALDQMADTWRNGQKTLDSHKTTSGQTSTDDSEAVNFSA